VPDKVATAIRAKAKKGGDKTKDAEKGNSPTPFL
jgi:hypothetical protein